MSSNLDTQLIWESYRNSNLEIHDTPIYELTLEQWQLGTEQKSRKGWKKPASHDQGVGASAETIFDMGTTILPFGKILKVPGAIGKILPKMGNKLITPTKATGAVKELVKKSPEGFTKGIAAAKEIAKKGVSKIPVGSGAVIGQGIKQGVKAVGKTAGKGALRGGAAAGKAAVRGGAAVAKGVGKTIAKNPGKSLMAYGAAELYNWGSEMWDEAAELLAHVWDNVEDALAWLQQLDIPAMLSGFLDEIAGAIVSYGIPVLVILILLYGGYKLLSWLFSNDDEQPNYSRA